MTKIAAAVGTASGRQYSTMDIERAMAEAVEQCHAAGITDPEQIREAINKARAEAKKAHTP